MRIEKNLAPRHTGVGLNMEKRRNVWRKLDRRLEKIFESSGQPTADPSCPQTILTIIKATAHRALVISCTNNPRGYNYESCHRRLLSH